MLTHCIIHTQNIANGRPAPVWSQRPSRVAEGKIKTKKRDPRRREKAPARCSSTGDAHTPPGHASPAARSMPDGRRPPRPLESAAAGACSSVARVQANAFRHSAPCTSTTALHSSAGLAPGHSQWGASACVAVQRPAAKNVAHLRSCVCPRHQAGGGDNSASDASSVLHIT